MKSYISRKFPLETRTTDQICEVRCATMSGERTAVVRTVRRALASQPGTCGIVKRRQSYGRGAHLAEDVDLEACPLAREPRRHVAGGKALADAVSVGAGGDVADRGTVLHDRFVADHVGLRIGHFHDYETALGARGALGERGSLAGKVRLVEIDEPIEPGFAC